MRQSHMSSDLSASSLIIPRKQVLNPKDDSLATLADIAIAPHTDRKTSSVPKMHCFEFRELLQAKRQRWAPQALGESQELQEIDAALARLSDGSYGTCIDCGGEIGRARLKTEPTARRCSSCEVRKPPIYQGDD